MRISVSVTATGRWDTKGHAADGKLDQGTLEAIVGDLIGQSRHNAALQLIIDYYDLDRAHAFNVVFEPTQLVRPGGSKPQAQTTRPLATFGTGGV